MKLPPSLQAVFTPPAFDDPRQTAAARLLHPILLAMVGFSLLVAVLVWLVAGLGGLRMSVAATLSLGVSLVLLTLERRAHVVLASRLLVILLWLMMTGLMFYGSGLHSPAFLAGNLGVIVVASLLLGGWASVWAATASLAAGLLLLLAESRRVWHPSSDLPEVALWFAALIIYGVVVVVQYLSARVRLEALDKAQCELAERRQAEQALVKSEERYRLISGVSTDYMFSTRLQDDGNWRMEWVAGAFEEITGYTFEEYIAKGGWLAHLHPDDLLHDTQDMDTLRSNRPVISEVRTLRKDGSFSWVRTYGHPIWDTEKNQLVGIYGAVQEISQRKQAETELRDSLEREHRLNEIARLINSSVSDDAIIPRVVQMAAELVDAESGSIALLTPDGQAMVEAYNYNAPPELIRIQPFADGAGVGWHVVLTGKSILLDEYSTHAGAMDYGVRAGIHAFIGVPVKAGEHALGALKLYNRTPGKRFDQRDLALVETIGQQAGVAIQNARLYDDAQQRARRLSILNEISQTVSSLRDLPDLLEVILQQTRRVLELDVFMVALYTPANNEVAFPIMFDSGERWQQPVIQLHDSSILKDVVQSGEPRLILRGPGEVRQAQDTLMRLGNVQRRSASLMYVPLRAAEEWVGVLSVQSYTLNAYKGDDLELLNGIGSQVAVAIHNARLYEAARRQLEELGMLQAIATSAVEAADQEQLLQRTIGIIGQNVFTDMFSIWLLDDPFGELIRVAYLQQKNTLDTVPKRIPLGTGVIGAVACDGLVRRIHDVRQEPLYLQGYPDVLSEMCVPLHIGERIIGVINVESRTLAAYDAGDERLLVTVADLLSTALERLRSEAEMEQRVRERTAQLEAANLELESFSYSISHDLRAPLRAIDGFSLALLEDYAPNLDPLAQNYLSRVRHNAQRMSQLIDDLLTFSRLGRKPLNKQPVQPDYLVQQVLEELQPTYQGRDVEFEFKPLPVCQADPALLRQVFVNLLSNAIKYSQQRHPSRIEVGWDETELAYYVRDNGVGFDMQFSDKLFGVFQRLHRAEEFEGTGVGLAIVQRVIQRHEGRVWVQAQVDLGATFYFSLPGMVAQ